MKNFKHLFLLLSLMAIPIYISSMNIRSPPQEKLAPKNKNISDEFFYGLLSVIKVPCRHGYIRSPKDNLCRETIPLVSYNHFQIFTYLQETKKYLTDKHVFCVPSIDLTCNMIPLLT